MTGPALRVEDLRFTYEGTAVPAIDGMSFRVEHGEVFGFLGPSGVGKTTTQRVVLGLVDGWSGTVEVLGRDRRDWGSDLFDRVGVAFELPVGYPRLTAVEDLEHFGNLHAVRARAPHEVLETVGLLAAADQPIATFSKGMRVRLNLARALLHDPELLFLDEPTAGLDPVNAGHVRELIRRGQDRGRTVFVTTHDMALASAVCDRVAFVVDGRIATCASPRELELAHGRREVAVEYRRAGELRTDTFPLGELPPSMAELLASGSVERVHTREATLDEVFVAVTGRRL